MLNYNSKILKVFKVFIKNLMLEAWNRRISILLDLLIVKVWGKNSINSIAKKKFNTNLSKFFFGAKNFTVFTARSKCTIKDKDQQSAP